MEVDKINTHALRITYVFLCSMGFASNFGAIVTTIVYKRKSSFESSKFFNVSPSETIFFFVLSFLATCLELCLFAFSDQLKHTLLQDLYEFLDGINQVIVLYSHFISMVEQMDEYSTDQRIGIATDENNQGLFDPIIPNCTRVLVAFSSCWMFFLKLSGFIYKMKYGPSPTNSDTLSLINSVYDGVSLVMLFLFISGCILVQIWLLIRPSFRFLLRSSGKSSIGEKSNRFPLCIILFNIVPIALYLPPFICDVLVFIDSLHYSSSPSGQSDIMAGIEVWNPLLKLFITFNDIVHPIIFLCGNGKGFKVVWEKRYNKIFVPFVEAARRKSLALLTAKTKLTESNDVISHRGDNDIISPPPSYKDTILSHVLSSTDDVSEMCVFYRNYIHVPPSTRYSSVEYLV